MSEREEQFAHLWKKFGATGVTWTRQHYFAKPRRWRFDFAECDHKVAVEIEGLTWYGGKSSRHQTTKGIQADMDKYNAAAVRGWRVLRFSQQHLDQDPIGVIETIEAALLDVQEKQA